MELKVNINYQQVLEIIKQLPVNQVAQLLIDAKQIIEEDKSSVDVSKFQEFILSAPTMTEGQYDLFLENRKMFNQWRAK